MQWISTLDEIDLTLVVFTTLSVIVISLVFI
jgi:hypothetical protein